MNILFLNNKKAQCGIHAIGERIYTLLHNEGFNCQYVEMTDTAECYRSLIDIYKPDIVIYNYYILTMSFLNVSLIKEYPHIKHIGIIHDSFNYLSLIDNLFDRWIVHDPTNTTISNKKFLTIRPIRRFKRSSDIDSKTIKIGTHGFTSSPWKMYDTIAEWINYTFNTENVVLNMNLPIASCGGSLEQVEKVANICKSKITKSNIQINITHHFFDTEDELIRYLSDNTMNVYFYNDAFPNLGVAGSADLAISSQSSLAVNKAYMYRHLHEYLGICTRDNLRSFISNQDKVINIYENWHPSKMLNDYMKMINTL